MSENSTESIIREERIPFPYLPERENPQPSSGSFWGKVAIATVAGVAGLVAGVLLAESDNDIEEACDCDDEDTEELEETKDSDED